jgi:hypothetical protein
MAHVKFTDKYSFGNPMFDGMIPVMKNGERAACIRNQDMVEPTEIQSAMTDQMGGKVIKTPCHKQCMALASATLTHTDSGESKPVYLMTCLEKAPYIEIEQGTISKTKSTLTLVK